MGTGEKTFGERDTLRGVTDGAPWQAAEGLTIGDLETLRDEGVVLAGRYKVVRRLGEGGMGSVWLAEDSKLDGKLFAIKMLPSVLAGKKGAYKQVKAEAAVAMKLSHPNIATVRAFEEDEGGSPFLVMDYIEGEGLDDILAERGPLGEEETRRVLGPVAAALDYAHSKGVVHRDVKPGNVMVAKDGTPYVLDFGIAREVQETMTRVTGKLSSGTLLYMSPEQMNGDRPRVAQDVYSFAAMAYECLAGEPPFCRGQIEWQIANKVPAPLAEGVASQALRDGILSGLAKEPEGRPGSCAGVLGGDEAAKRAREEREAREAEESERLAAQKAAAEEEAARLEAERAAEEKRKAAEALAARPEGWSQREGTRAGERRTVRVGSQEVALRWCPAGTFMMGSRSGEGGRDNDEQQHRVTLSRGFWMGETEVTQGLWKAVTGRNPSHFKGDNLPVEQMSWEDCERFVKALNERYGQAGMRWALPTEAQWEYACRAESTGPYAGTGRLEDMGWYIDNSGSKTHPVGTKQPNAWGLYDMHGNVWEWCADCFGDYPSGPVTDPSGRQSGSNRVYRGGSWFNYAGLCRSAGRHGYVPDSRYHFLGLRVALLPVP